MLRLISILLTMSLLSSCQKASEREIDEFCSDLNILLIQKDVIVSNISNINTTRTPEGGPYIPQMVKKCQGSACEIVPLTCSGIGCNPIKDKREPILKYQPNHPDANEHGYVAYPSINPEEEKKKLEKIELAISLLLKTTPIKESFFFSKDSEKYFKKYPKLDSEMNFRKLINEGK